MGLHVTPRVGNEIPSATLKTRSRPGLEKIGMFLAVVAPPCLTFYAAIALTRGHVSWGYPLLAFVLASLTNLGTTAGYHRMLTHQAFKAHPVVQYALLILGAIAGMSSPIVWAHDHLYHHSHSDSENDLHSPHTRRFEGMRFEKIYQWLHAHTGWLFRDTIHVSSKACQSADTPAARFRASHVLFLAAGRAVRAPVFRLERLFVGGYGALVPQPSYYMEREFRLPSMGTAAVSGNPRQKQEQRHRRRPRVGRRLAQQPPFSPRFGASRPAAETTRPHVYRHLPAGALQVGFPCKTVCAMYAMPKLALDRRGKDYALCPMPRGGMTDVAN